VYRDVPPWLDLAACVEDLFGPMLDDAAFYDALLRNIGRGTAYCVREADGPPGNRLLGGLLFSPGRAERPEHRIGWLAVDSQDRRSGIGTALVDHVMRSLPTGATISVVTFTDDVEGGQPARRFYEKLGFSSARSAEDPEISHRQIYRLVIP
jgi:ribosomal protein S18 acetylase RimI-like enzyme